MPRVHFATALLTAAITIACTQATAQPPGAQPPGVTDPLQAPHLESSEELGSTKKNSGQEVELDGERITIVRRYDVEVTLPTLTIVVRRAGGMGMGGMGMGMEGMAGMGMGGYGEGESGGYGGEGGMGGYGDMGMGMGGMGSGMAGGLGGGYPGMGGMGMEGGMEGGRGGMGMGGGGGMMGAGGMGPGGMGMPGGGMGGMPAFVHALVLDELTEGSERPRVVLVQHEMHRNQAGMGGFVPAFSTLQGKDEAFQKRWSLSDKKYQLMQDLAKQAVWRAEGAQIIRNTKGQGPNSELAEAMLKEVLRENYNSQLARQELQIDQLKQQITELQTDIDRRRAAVDRVADLELARIVLTAQGLIEEKQQ